MDRLEEIRQRAAGIPLVGPLAVALKRYDDGELACEISRMTRKDIPALLDIAGAALAWWRAERRFDETKQDSRDYVVAAKAYVLFNEACAKWEAGE